MTLVAPRGVRPVWLPAGLLDSWCNRFATTDTKASTTKIRFFDMSIGRSFLSFFQVE